MTKKNYIDMGEDIIMLTDSKEIKVMSIIKSLDDEGKKTGIKDFGRH